MGFSTGGRYVGQPFGPTSHLGYDTLQSPPVVDNELSHTFRGMVVEEDYNPGHLPQSMPGPAPNPQQCPPNLQPRTPYNIYPQADYAHYYNSVVREQYVDFAYGYDPYHPGPDRLVYVNPRGMSGAGPPTLYPNLSSAEVHRQQPGRFFDYGLTVRAPVSQFYYPFHQHLLYLPPPHSPMHIPQLTIAAPNLTDKEPEFHVSTVSVSHVRNSPRRNCQHSMEQQIAPSNVMLDYGPQQPVLLPGGPVYGYNSQTPFYHQGTVHPHHDLVEAPVTLRSSLLDEFRSNKSRKWELMVRPKIFIVTLITDVIRGRRYSAP